MACRSHSLCVCHKVGLNLNMQLTAGFFVVHQFINIEMYDVIMNMNTTYQNNAVNIYSS